MEEYEKEQCKAAALGSLRNYLLSPALGTFWHLFVPLRVSECKAIASCTRNSERLSREYFQTRTRPEMLKCHMVKHSSA